MSDILIMEKEKINIIWFRRDLRVCDNIALRNIINSDNKFIPIFIYDKNILNKLDDKYDRRVDFIHKANVQLNNDLNNNLQTFFDEPLNVFNHLIKTYDIESVYFNMDYEPYAMKRDTEIQLLLKQNKINLKLYQDQVIFGPNRNLKANNEPYTMFSPYFKQWYKHYDSELNQQEFFPYDHESNLKEIHSKLFYCENKPKFLTLSDIGFNLTDIELNVPNLESKDFEDTITNYELYRNNIQMDMTSKISIHLRFGTVSIRKLANVAYKFNETYLKELAWREFFMQVLYHFPRVEHQSFKLQYEDLNLRNNEDEFLKWCNGETGFPLVDAAMIQLNKTGYMHNRLRMLTASFLCKHLLIDWRWGEGYFALKLNDFELASNNGNWQWCASSGVDSVPYFRMFSPLRQQEEYDPNYNYVKKWIPEFKVNNYIKPIITHAKARERYLLLVNSTYKK